MQEGLEDHLDVMEHLKRSYADAEEVQAAERINTLHEDIAQLCRQDEQRITDIIQGEGSRHPKVHTSLLPLQFPALRPAHGCTSPCARPAALFGLTRARASGLHVFDSSNESEL